MTERTHAFLAARYYEYLTRKFGQQGKAAFVHATRHYAEQRGRRMARRALRDGEELNWTSYYRYGEWVSSPECIAEGTSNQHSFIRYEPEGVLKITRCPWKAQFAEMGVDGTAGALYCSVLDDSIAAEPGLHAGDGSVQETGSNEGFRLSLRTPVLGLPYCGGNGVRRRRKGSGGAGPPGCTGTVRPGYGSKADGIRENGF